MEDLFLTEAWPILAKMEGGYSNNPSDSGGETFKGISRVRHPEWLGWQVIDGLKTGDFPKNALSDEALLQLTIKFYRKEFWDSIGGDEMPPALALDVFDCGVNCGQGTAVQMLQRILNVMNKQGQLYADIKADGKWGPGTKKALEGYLSTRANMNVLITAYGCLRGAYYIKCAEDREKNEDFEFGWFVNRVLSYMPK